MVVLVDIPSFDWFSLYNGALSYSTSSFINAKIIKINLDIFNLIYSMLCMYAYVSFNK